MDKPLPATPSTPPTGSPGPPAWERVRARFHDALSRPPGDRAALLREIAAADPDVAREVASLLAAHDDASAEFLDPPHDLAPGARLGSFEILSIAGRGGMGEVYKARDLRLDRLVALKIVPEALEREA